LKREISNKWKENDDGRKKKNGDSNSKRRKWKGRGLHQSRRASRSS